MCYAFDMGKASEIHLTEEERNQLESWVRKGTMEQRFVERARIVLEAATGKTTKEIAQSLKRRPATVSKWRTRFSRQGMAGLSRYAPTREDEPSMTVTPNGGY
jgi:IS30 family transposase